DCWSTRACHASSGAVHTAALTVTTAGGHASAPLVPAPTEINSVNLVLLYGSATCWHFSIHPPALLLRACSAGIECGSSRSSHWWLLAIMGAGKAGSLPPPTPHSPAPPGCAPGGPLRVVRAGPQQIRQGPDGGPIEQAG